MPDAWTLLPLLLVAFTAGLVDAAVGGGGLIQLPGLFGALPSAPAPLVLGTNKFASMWGTGTAAWRYARTTPLDARILLPAALTAFAASFVGARAVTAIPREVVRPMVIVLLVVMLVYTLTRRDFGTLHRPAHIGPRERAIALLIGAGIGFYDGFFGPGTGTFLVFLFIRFFGLDFLRASAAAKVVNLATNLAALVYFVPSGLVMFELAVPMAAANMTGALVGARLALKGGAPLVKRLFVVLVVALIAKLVWDAV